jgi:DNA mismatch endonuclease (patch repair protein)
MAVLGPSRWTLPERRVHLCLVRNRVPHRCHFQIPGTKRSADFKVGDLLVFVDGRFWHDPMHRTRTMSPYWRDKVARNALRDRETRLICRRLGYRVVRLWDDDPRLLPKLKASL